jgi:hypothetical protein
MSTSMAPYPARPPTSVSAGAGRCTGDLITVDVPARSIHLEASDDEPAHAAPLTPPPALERGYG